jgi:hypothetical protein
MRRTPEMPVRAGPGWPSALIHVAALLGPGWTLPGTNEPEPPATIDAVLAKPAPRPEAAPVAKPAPKPPASRPAAASAAGACGRCAGIGTRWRAGGSAPRAPARSRRRRPSRPAAPSPVRIALPGKGRVRYVITRGEGGFVVGQSVHSWEHDGLPTNCRA